MGWVILIAALLIISAIIIWAVARKAKWKLLLEERRMTDKISNLYSYLLKQGIRCRLQEAGEAQQAGMGLQPGGQKVRLEVHKDDFEKAKALAQENADREFYSTI